MPSLGKGELPRVSDRRPVVRRSIRLVTAYALTAVAALLALLCWLSWLLEPQVISLGAIALALFTLIGAAWLIGLGSKELRK